MFLSSGFAGSAGDRYARAAVYCATVIGQEAEQTVHRRKIRRIENESPVLPRRDKLCVEKLFQMKRQRRGRDAQMLGDLACRQSAHALLNEAPEYIQASVLRESGECANCFCRFHISMIIEIIAKVKQLT
jgi:hypothetical protein